ncbi:bacteriocin [Limosilactobacillus reuteri]|uniref:bacteriocin n=1 Tax=Limosilactobacillus reuteri TaxID=1598 RepID=UPI0011D15511|nr:bacteriocin [Limosilactobacillus reuteri]
MQSYKKLSTKQLATTIGGNIQSSQMVSLQSFGRITDKDYTYTIYKKLKGIFH